MSDEKKVDDPAFPSIESLPEFKWTMTAEQKENLDQLIAKIESTDFNTFKARLMDTPWVDFKCSDEAAVFENILQEKINRYRKADLIEGSFFKKDAPDDDKQSEKE